MEIENTDKQDFQNQDQQKIQDNLNNNQEIDKEEEEDDWIPSGYNDTILNKVKVDYSDKKIKFLENKLEKQEKRLIQMGQFKEQENKQKQQNQQNQFPEPQPKKQQNSKENQISDEDPSDNENNINESNPDFYDPLKDEKYEDWINKEYKKEEQQQIVLSCPSCFQQLCYNCQAHQQFESQYRSYFAKNVKIDCSKIVTPKFLNKNNKKQKQKKQNPEIQKQKINNDNFQSIEELIKTNTEKKFTDKQLEDQYFLENKRADFEIFFATFCQVCDAEVGAFEADSKLYIFFNVIPSLG